MRVLGGFCVKEMKKEERRGECEGLESVFSDFLVPLLHGLYGII